jgi:hypothetical protein
MDAAHLQQLIHLFAALAFDGGLGFALAAQLSKEVYADYAGY